MGLSARTPRPPRSSRIPTNETQYQLRRQCALRSIEASGKTVKDAIRNGLAELGCDSDDVDIQVIEMGSPG
ncbi:MAG: Jag N-terminal domain-containing protein, partial [Clostridia bacterium]|nr:Jag N-terminal domain-containing protein [Clostridia bacterium]